MTPNRQLCRGTKPDGRPCRATRMDGSDFCFFHDPNKAAERLAAQQSGGLKGRMAVLPPETPAVSVQTAGDVIGLLSETIHQVRTGQVDPKVGNCVGYLAGIVLKAGEQGDLEDRLAALEQAIGAQGRDVPRFETEPGELVIDDGMDGAGSEEGA